VRNYENMKVFNVTQFWEPNCANGETANIPAMAKPCQIVAEVGRNRNFRHERGRFYSKVSNVAGESPVAPRAFHPLPRSRDICKGRGFDVPMSYGFGQVSGTFLGSGRWSGRRVERCTCCAHGTSRWRPCDSGSFLFGRLIRVSSSIPIITVIMTNST
jgi:hypothetical protein